MRVFLLILLIAGQSFAQLWPFPGPGVAGAAGGGPGMVTRALEYYYEPALGDEGDNTKIIDKSATSYDFALNNGAAFGSLGVDFDGVNDYALAASANDPQALNGGDVTVILILKIDAAEVSCAAWTRELNGPAFRLNVDSSGFFDATLPVDGFSRGLYSGTTDLRGGWVMVTMRSTSGDQDLIYNDGSAYDSAAFSGTISDSSAEDMVAGAANQYNENCTMSLGGLYVYSDNLTDVEVGDQYDYVKAAYPAGITGDLP